LIKKTISSFIDALVELTPLCVCALLGALFISTVFGLTLSFSSYPVLIFYFSAMLLFGAFFISIRVYDEVQNKVDCYMQAAVSCTFIGLMNCEIFMELKLIQGWFSNPYWDYKVAFFLAATFWHALIMKLLFNFLKKRKTASIRMQPKFKNLA